MLHSGRKDADMHELAVVYLDIQCADSGAARGSDPFGSFTVDEPMGVWVRSRPGGVGGLRMPVNARLKYLD
jgi:hypothetical protein